MLAAAVTALAASAAVALSPTATPPKLVHFQSTSGNINCEGQAGSSFGPAFVDCLVRKNTWPARITPRKPANCDLDFDPYTLELGRGKVIRGACRGDIGPLCAYTTDKCTTLGYGRSVDMGTIRCTSATIGVTCRYKTGSRAGFLIARERYVVYR